MKKHGLIIGLLCLFNYGKCTYAQCDAFSQAILKIIKTESYSDFSKYIQPTEELIKILHWENDSTSNALLQSLNDSLFHALIQNAKDIRDTIISKGNKLSSVKYENCSIGSGAASEILIRFSIDGLFDSLKVLTMETSRTYIVLPLEYHIAFTPEVINFKIDHENNFATFKPQKDELELGEKYLQEYLKNNTIIYTTYRFILGYQNEKNHTFLRYIVFQANGKIKLLEVDLMSGSWAEIVSE